MDRPTKPGIYHRKETDTLAECFISVDKNLYASSLVPRGASCPVADLVGDWQQLDAEPAELQEIIDNYERQGARLVEICRRHGWVENFNESLLKWIERKLDAEPVTCALPKQVIEVCQQRGWSLKWDSRLAYLALEAAEFVEAARGKGGDKRMEAGDVVITAMALIESQGVSWEVAMEEAAKKISGLRTKARYSGDKAAEIFAGVKQEPDQIAGLKGIIARQDAEIAELKEQLIAQRVNLLKENQQSAKKLVDNLQRLMDIAMSHGWDEGWTDPDLPTWLDMRLAEAEVLSASPVVIEGRGQRVEEGQQGYWIHLNADGSSAMCKKQVNDVFTVGRRYMKRPEFPPRPAFQAPSKPEFLIRRKGDETDFQFWAYKRAGGYLAGNMLYGFEDYEQIDEATGEAVNGEKAR